MENYDFLELVLEYYLTDTLDILIENLISLGRKGLMTDTYKFVSIYDLGLDENSPTLKDDLRILVMNTIDENNKLFNLVDDIVDFCIKNNILSSVVIFKGKVEFTFDDFSLDEISELRKIISKNFKIIDDEYLSNNGRAITIKL